MSHSPEFNGQNHHPSTMTTSNRQFSPKTEVVLFFLLSILMVYGVSYPLLQRGFWLDEAMTAWVSQQSPLDILAWSAQEDIALPLPYLLYWAGGLLFGHSEIGLRWLSVLLTALSLTALFAAFRQQDDKRAWLIGLLAILPTVHWITGEVRYYAALVLASAFSHYASARFINQEKMPVWGLAAAWTLPPLMHPLGAVVTLFNMVVTAVYLTSQRRLQSAIISALSAGLAILALLLPFILDDVNRQTFWPGTLDLSLTFREMAGFLVSGRYLGDPWLPVLLIGVISLTALWLTRTPIVILGVVTLWGGWAVLLLGIYVKPVFQVRYTLPLLASWLIVALAPLFAKSVEGWKRPFPPLIFILTFISLVWFGSIADDYPDRDIQLREAATWIDEHAAANDLIVAWPPDATNAVQYYFPNTPVTNWGPDGIWSLENMPNFADTRGKMPDGAQRVWLLNMTYYADHDPALALQTALEQRGSAITETREFDFITVNQMHLPDTPLTVKHYPLDLTLADGPHLEEVVLLQENWCVNQPNPVYLSWRRLPQQEPSHQLRVSVRLTPNESDLTPLAQQDGSPIPEYGKVTYFPAWWPENRQNVGRFSLTPVSTGEQWLIIIPYLENNGAFTILDQWPITQIDVESCP